MENNDEKLDLLFAKLRQSQPILNAPDLMTDTIMRTVKNTQRAPHSLMLIWVRIISTSVAVFLLGLFVGLQTVTANRAATDIPTANYLDVVAYPDSLCEQFKSETKMVLTKDAVVCHILQNSFENKRFKKLVKQFSK